MIFTVFDKKCAQRTVLNEKKQSCIQVQDGCLQNQLPGATEPIKNLLRITCACKTVQCDVMLTSAK